MTLHRISSSTIIFGALLILSACGGGSDESGNLTATTPQNLQEYADSFTTKINVGLTALGTSSGLNAKTVADVFDAKYLDMGFTKTNLLEALTVSAVALGTSPELSLFPMAQVSNPKLSNCDANSVCTLDATLVNSDADITSISFSTKVIVVSGVVYLYGDQSSSTSI